MKKKLIVTQLACLLLCVSLVDTQFLFARSDEPAYDYNNINAGQGTSFDQYQYNTVNQQNFINQQNQRLRNLYTTPVKVIDPVKQLNIEQTKPDIKPELQNLPDNNQEFQLTQAEPIKTGFIQKVKEVIVDTVKIISRGIRNLYYMVTGQWGEVKSLRNEITKQNTQKPGALALLIGNTEIKTLSIKKLQDVAKVLDILPVDVSYSADSIKADFDTAVQQTAQYREKLNNLDIETLKSNIELYNGFFAGIQLNEEDIIFLREIVNNLHEQLISFEGKTLLDKRVCVIEQKEALDLLKEGVDIIQTTEGITNAFKEMVNAIRIAINPSLPEDVPYEVIKDKISEIDYIAYQIIMGELAAKAMPFVEGAVKGDFIENPSWQNIVGQMLGGLNPLDFIADGRDTTAGVIQMVKTKLKDGKLNTSCAAIGFIPFFGNALKICVKSIFKNADIAVKSGKKVITILSKSGPQKTVKSIIKTGKISSKWLKISADEVNAKLLKRYIKLGGKAEDFFLPYKPGSKIYEFTLDKPKRFLRAYDGSQAHRYGVWLDKAQTIEVNPEKYFSKMALPDNYNYYQIIEVQAGTRMRVGITNGGNFNGIIREGGAVQFEAVCENFDELEDYYKIINERVPIRK